MVKTTGPLLSQHASGTLAKTLTFSNYKGKSYVKRSTIPLNPKSQPQQAMRAMLKWLTQNWETLSDEQKGTWTTAAFPKATSSYNAFIQYNLAEWSAFNAPTKTYPTNRGGSLAPMFILGAAWEEHRIKITYQAFDTRDGWGLNIFADLNNLFTTAPQNLVVIVTLQDVQEHTVYWTPPSRTTYYINNRAFTTYGRSSSPLGQFEAAP